MSIEDYDGPWSRLFERLYHQGTTGGATYASFPHLVRLAEQVDGPDREEVCVSLGVMAAGIAKYGEPIPDDLAPAFYAARDAAANLSVQLLAGGCLRADQVHFLAFGALALVLHPAGRLIDGNLFPTDPPEVECECTSCGAGYMVLLREDGLAVQRVTAYRQPAPPVVDSRQPVFEMPRASQGFRSPDATTTWASLAARFEEHRAALGAPKDVGECLEAAAAACRAGIDARTEHAIALVVVAASVMAYGNVAHGRQLMRLAGSVRCPECDEVAPLTSQMLDFQDPP